tara:strand:+ start:121955 stop:122185 length:231 start_codon:yes stop_codon:yes gene_type:complete
VSEITNLLMMGDLTALTIIIWAIVALFVGAIGGAIGGIIVGGEHLGNELAAMMGAFYGPIAALPGVVIALLVLVLL